MRAFQSAGSRVGDDRYIEIRYEDFCDQPQTALNKVIDFLGLPDEDTPLFFEAVSRMSFESQNDKWRHDLTHEQQRLLDEYLAPLLVEFGYDPARESTGTDSA